jgi:hypothetical protein
MSNINYCNTPSELVDGAYELTLGKWAGVHRYITAVLAATPIPTRIISKATHAINKVSKKDSFLKHITMFEVVFHGKSIIRVRVKGGSEQVIMSLDVSDMRVSECSVKDYIKRWSTEVCSSFS